MKCNQDLCLNLWYDLKKLLWQDELNPRVRCAFGNVSYLEECLVKRFKIRFCSKSHYRGLYCVTINSLPIALSQMLSTEPPIPRWTCIAWLGYREIAPRRQNAPRDVNGCAGAPVLAVHPRNNSTIMASSPFGPSSSSSPKLCQNGGTARWEPSHKIAQMVKRIVGEMGSSPAPQL